MSVPAGQTLSRDALHSRGERRARRLLRQGLRGGQVVACAADSGADLILMQNALARSGAALFPLPSGLGEQSRRDLLGSVSAEWIWSADAGILAATGMAPATPGAAVPGLAVLIRTSGSSGEPRVAMLSADNVLASCLRVNARLGLGPGDEWLCCLPLHAVGGLAIGYRCALAGAALRLHPGFDAWAVSADLIARRVSHLSLVPPMLARLLDLGIEPPASLRVALVGGQALHSALARRGLEAGWPLHVSYGMSETFSQVITARLEPGADLTELGPPLPDVALDCGDCGAPPGALKIRGPMVMAGYGNPERSPGEGLIDGWLHTRDLACRTQSGGLRLLGREDDLLVIGGIQVLPAALESRLAALPGIDDLAVVAVEHPVWGATLAACYSGDLARDDLMAWCRTNLSGPERARIILRYSALPVLPNGKRDRRRLQGDASRVL